jgi:hypothetical protein
LEAFGNKPTTIQRLRSGTGNQSDLGGVLQRSNIHLKTCAPGQVSTTLKALRESPKTVSQKAKFILATDGVEFQAESLEGDGETLERIYLGRRFKHDSERLEKLFELYTKMAGTPTSPSA